MLPIPNPFVAPASCAWAYALALSCIIWHAPASAQGIGTTLATDGAGSLSSIHAESGWRSTWHIAAAGNFDGLGYHDVLIYDRIHGDGRFMSVAANGDFNSIALHTNWGTSWDQVVTGNFGGNSQTDLLFYSATTGQARFYTTGANGTISLLQAHTGWNEWDTIVTGQFGGNSRTDLFLYSRTRGQGKFFTTDGLGNITLLANYTALNKNWDQIVPGDFNGDGLTDLFFYQRVRGEAKFYNTDGAGGLQLMSHYTGLRTSWDKVVAGSFGGSARTDLLFYDRTAGEARFAFTDGIGGWQLQPVVNASHSWSQLLAGSFAGGNQRLFAYDNTVRVRIHAVRCTDDNGGRATAINPSQVQSWVDRANIVYAAAGVKLEFDPATDFETVQSTALNTLDTCSEFATTAQCDYHKAAASYWAQLNQPCKVVVYFRWGANTWQTGSGFSSETANYIAMPAFSNTVSYSYFQDASNPLHGASIQNIKLLAHELGHFFGLDHTFIGLPSGSAPHAQVVSYLASVPSPTLAAIDGDRDETWDTPPDVGKDYFTHYGWNPADLTQEIRIVSASLGVDFTFSPDRHNVMNYFGLCDDYLRVSPDQVRKVREVLHTAKSNYISACAHFLPGTTQSYGSGCLASSGVAPLHRVSGGLAVGQTALFAIDGTPWSPAFIIVGNQRAQVSLSSIGLPACSLLVNNTPSVAITTNGVGDGFIAVSIPPSSALVGALIMSQFAVVDVGATTTLPVVTSNAVELRIGGDR